MPSGRSLPPQQPQGRCPAGDGQEEGAAAQPGLGSAHRAHLGAAAAAGGRPGHGCESNSSQYFKNILIFYTLNPQFVCS